ncbi:MAG: hypothetical protein H6608_06190 [Flavobacteriales bacterium]|nr:hypothetical protein [Bacteroidota bacterium]MCB9240698.1 hypothetical protein [Flavobacteriales bacterium]
MALNERWNVDISGRSIDKWADLDLLFINVPFGVVPDKPAGILEYQLEIGVSQEIELIPKLNLLPEVGIVFREITYVYMIRIPVEYLTLKPEPPIHNAGLRYSCSLLYSAGKKERVLLGITGGYCDFNGLDTWLLGYQLGVRFNVKRKIVINE